MLLVRLLPTPCLLSGENLAPAQGIWSISSVRVNFMCQLKIGLSHGVPRHLVKHSGVSMRVFFSEINI